MSELPTIAARLLGFGALVAITAVAPDVHATYSVLLRNSDSGEMGGAVVSCVGDFDLQAIFGYARPANGSPVVFFTQAWYSEGNHEQALRWLESGNTIDDVLAKLTDPTFDESASERQYHFLQADAALTWTGAETLPYAAGLTGTHGPWRYSIAGNILTSSLVLESAEESLQTEAGSIEERLIGALEAGNDHDEGDSRCTPLPGDSAYIEVRDATGAIRVQHSVVGTGDSNPLARLRNALGLTAPVSPPDNAPSAPPSAPTIDSIAGSSTAGESTVDPTASESSEEPALSPSKVNDQRSVGCQVSRSPRPSATAWLAAAIAVGTALGCARRKARNQAPSM